MITRSTLGSHVSLDPLFGSAKKLDTGDKGGREWSGSFLVNGYWPAL